jgi:hypothetical protein
VKEKKRDKSRGNDNNKSLHQRTKQEARTVQSCVCVCLYVCMCKRLRRRKKKKNRKKENLYLNDDIDNEK